MQHRLGIKRMIFTEHTSLKRRAKTCRASIAAAGCAAFLILHNVCGGRQTFFDRTIKGPTTLTSEWMEIFADPPLKPEREEHEIAKIRVHMQLRQRTMVSG